MQILQARTGDVVRVRRRKWRISDVRQFDGCEVVTLASLGAADFGLERRIVVPFDRLEPIPSGRHARFVRVRAWRRACRTLLAQNTPPDGLRSAGRAQIDLLPHQLEPALAIVRGLGTRVLLADAVGLGKTIEAGLIALELMERAMANRVLVLAPAGLRDQWTAELASRFHLCAVVVDSRELRRRRAELPIGVNPWQTIELAVASIDFVKRPEIFASVSAVRWDVLIVDEAHNVSGDNDRHAAVAALAARTPYVVLATATPHSGDASAFSALCNVGAHGDGLLVFRRSRRDVGLAAGRRVHLLHVRPSAAERRMHALVDDLSQAVVHEGTPSDAVWLALAVLNKRALSSARSLQQTVERRLAAVELEPDDAPYQLGLPLEDGDGETDKADEPPELSGLSLSNPVHERRLLQELAAAAGAAAAAGETKLAALVRLLRRIGEPAVVFTEYRDTLQHLARRLRRPAAILHGGLSRGARAAALSDFTSGRRAVLLTTDAAGEGLNLHQACRLVINLELPWNPMRLEQRIGRVDRIGQRRKVHAVHLIARSTGETRILERLRARIARARQSIGAPDPLAGEDERTIARFLLDERVNTEEAVPAATALPLAAPSLASEARAEAERLDEVRRILASNRGKPALEPDGAWISWTRQRATRSALRGRVLVIARSTCEDGWGRRADSALVPMLIPWQRGKIDGIDAERSASSIATSIAPSVVRQAEAALASWRERAIATGNRFFAARLARARAIAGVKRDAPFLFQPGLFDRRAEHQRLADATRSADEHEQSTREVLSLERRSRLSIGSPEILLVLLP